MYRMLNVKIVVYFKDLFLVKCAFICDKARDFKWFLFIGAIIFINSAFAICPLKKTLQIQNLLNFCLNLLLLIKTIYSYSLD